MNNGIGKYGWLVGIMVALFISLLSYIWVDREGRISALETRVEFRETEWHRARYVLHDRITTLEHEVSTLKARLGPAYRE
jgi:hypothetical protein